MTDPRLMYEMLDPRMLYAMLGEQSTFLNLGDWEDSPTSWDTAAHALALRLGEAATLAPGQQVLDVGFGYADQDLLWMDRFAPARIVGVNLSDRQVADARRRVAELGLSDRIDLRLGSATETGFADGTFDRVIGLESAMHFQTRDRFFEEARRVLRRGGRLALADIALMPEAGQDPLAAARTISDALIGRCPPENLYDRHEYAARLTRAGFRDVRVESIREHVFEGLQRHVFRRGREMTERWNPWARMMPGWSAGIEGVARTVSGAFWARYDYVIATAQKA